jgi:hypothetical protein
VNGIGTASQAVSVLNLPSTVDDTVFAGGGRQRLLFSDTPTGIVYALTGNFAGGQALSASDTLGQIEALNQTTGAFNPLVTGLGAPHGEALTAALPEPTTWSTMIVGFFGAGAFLRRRRSIAIAAG